MHQEAQSMDVHRNRSRRAVLAAAAGAGTAWLVGLFGMAQRTNAANGSAVILGSTSNSASASTGVVTSSGTGIAGTGPIGVNGTTSSSSTSAAGVYGAASTTGNYGVFSSGKMGVVGPVELSALTISNYMGPVSGKTFVYVRTTSTGTELRVKFPSGVDKLIAGG
jgi:hypothetical protein